jgi:uncharacterized protein (DUF983 family)
VSDAARRAPVSPVVMVWRGVTRRCPQCGQGHIFRNWFTLLDECPRCGLRFDRNEEGYWSGAMAVNIVVTAGLFFAVFALVLVATWPDVRWGWLLGAVIALNVVFPIVFYPFSKTIWMALSMWWGPLEPAELERIQPPYRGSRSLR